MNKGIVATGAQVATQAAADILRAGGKAFDAAVSAVFTSMTSEFALTGVGGGGAMMIQTPGSEPLLYDFFVNTPPRTGKEELDFFGVEVDFGDSTQIFHIGKGSAAVPGTLLGLTIVQEEYGNLPLSVVMEPAIYLAREGSVLNKKQAYIFKLLEPIFSRPGRFWPIGSFCVRSGLGGGGFVVRVGPKSLLYIYIYIYINI